MKRGLCFLLTFSIFSLLLLGQLFSPIKPVSGLSSSFSSSSTYEGDLVIGGNNVTALTGRFDIEGDIVVRGNATLILEDVTVNFIGTRRELRLERPSNGNPRLLATSATITSTRSFWIRFYGNSFATVSESSLEGFIGTYDSSVVSILDSAIEETMQARGSSVVTVSGGSVEARVDSFDSARVSIRSVSIIYQLNAYDSSILSVSDSSVMEKLYAFDSSTVSLDSVTINYQRIIGVESGLSSYNSSRVTISKSKVEWLRTFDSSTVLIFGTTLRDNGMRCYDSSVVFISSATIIGVDLIAYDFSFINIVNSFITNVWEGRGTCLDAYGSSRVWMSNTKMMGSLSARDSSDVHIENSKEVWLLSASDSSVVSVYNSNVTLLRTHDSSVTSILESSIKLLRAYDSSAVDVSRSTVEELFIHFGSVNFSIAGLAPGSFKEWNFWLESSMVVAPSGYAPDVTLENTQIQRGWGFSLFGSSNVTISDSTLEYLGLSGSSVVQLINSIVAYPYIESEAKVYVQWYLDVHVLSGANVTVLYSDVYPDGTVADYKWNVTNGLARFALVEKMMNVSGTYLFGSYTVKAVSNGYSDQQSLKMTGNRSVTMTPPLPLWQEYWYVIIAFVAVAATLAIVSLRIRKRKFT